MKKRMQKMISVGMLLCLLLSILPCGAFAEDTNGLVGTITKSDVVVSNHKKGIYLKWNAVAGATSYKVYRKTGSNGAYEVISTQLATSRTYTDKNVQNGGTYYYRIHAYVGTLKGDCETVKKYRLTHLTPSAAADQNSCGVKLSWKKNDKATGYKIQYSTNKDFSSAKKASVSSNTTLSKTITNLTPNTTYYFKVRAYKKDGSTTWYSAWSDVVSKKVTLPPNIRKLDPNKKMVALTYDDGPYTPVTSRILDTLEKNNGRATFFVVGNRVSTYASVVKRASNMGCQIGNHTWDHSTLTKLSSSQIKSQLSKCDDAVYKTTGKHTKVCRPVGGAYNSTVKSASKYPLIIWSVDTEDWKSRNATSVYNRVIGHVSDGSIVLMHDLYDSTASASEKIIPKLRSQGYQLVTLEELAYYKGVTLKAGAVYTSIR